MGSNRDTLLDLVNEIAVYHDLRDRNNLYKTLINQTKDAEAEDQEALAASDTNEKIDLIYDNLLQRTEGACCWAAYKGTDPDGKQGTDQKGYASELNDLIPSPAPDYLKNAFTFVGNWNERINGDSLQNLKSNDFLYDSNVSLASIIYGSNFPEGLERSSIDCTGNVDSAAPVVNISELKQLWLQPNLTDTNLVKFFAQGIPTIELSQAVPYFDLKIIDRTKDSVITTSDKSRAGGGMSVVKFIKGFGEIEPVDKELLEAALPTKSNTPNNPNEPTNENDAFTDSVSGMELFTLPQTYQGTKSKYIDLNPNGLGGNTVRKNSILDPFRPLMTVKSFKYTIDTSYATMPTIRGTLDIVLHDRSRLHEIAPLIRPDANMKQEFLIEFGWSHPRTDTLYGKFLNACRQERKFIVRSSSYSFDTNGHVNITINLLAKGQTTFAKELPSAMPGDGAVDIFRELTAIIKELQEKLSVDRETTVSLNQSFALGKFTSAGDLITVKESDLKALRTQVAKFKADANNKNELVDEMLTGVDSAVQRVVAYRDQVNSTFGKMEELVKAKIVKNSEEPVLSTVNKRKTHQAHDPWATCWPKVKEVHGEATTAGFSTETHISVGRLLSIICLPVLMKQSLWDQIEFVYYPCNKDSFGLSKFPSIASLPVQKTDFMKQLKLFRTVKAPNPPLLTLIHLVLKFVKEYKGNDSGWAIGGALTSVVDQKTGKVSTKYSNKDKKSYTSRITKASMIHYKAPRRVKNPAFKVDVDTVPFKNDKTKSILRISIMDGATDSYRTYSDVVRSLTSDASGILAEALGDDAEGTAEGYKVAARNAIKKLDAAGYLREIPKSSIATGENAVLLNGKKYAITAGASRIKHFLSTVIPTFKYGTEFSIIKSTAVSSNTDSELGLINIKRNVESADRPTGTEADDSVPFEVLPSTLALTTVGCPFFRHLQQYFFDYQTNTSIDNVYIVTGVEHTLTPGNYESSLKLSKVEFYGTFENLSTKLTELQSALESSKS